MSNKFSSNSTDVQKLAKELTLDDIMRLKAQKEAESRRTCHHTNVNKAQLIPIKDANLPRHIKQKYEGYDTVMVCGGEGGCGEIIDMQLFTKSDIDNGFFMLRSILNQMQIVLGANFNDEDQSQIISGFTSLEYLEQIVDNVYGKMREMTEKKNNKNHTNKPNKGSIGVSSAMYHG